MKAKKMVVNALILLVVVLLGYEVGDAQAEFSVKEIGVKKNTLVLFKPGLILWDFIPELKIDEDTVGIADKNYGTYSTKLYYVDMSLGNPCYIDKEKYVHFRIRPQPLNIGPQNGKYELHFYGIDKKFLFSSYMGKITLSVSGNARFYVLVEDKSINANQSHAPVSFTISVEYEQSEPNDSLDSATPIIMHQPGESEVIMGRIEPMGDKDFYSIKIDEDCTLALLYNSSIEIFSRSNNGITLQENMCSYSPRNIEVVHVKKGTVAFFATKYRDEYSYSFVNKYDILVSRLPWPSIWHEIYAAKDAKGKYASNVKEYSTNQGKYKETIITYLNSPRYMAAFFSKIDLQEGDFIIVKGNNEVIKTIRGKKTNIWVSTVNSRALHSGPIVNGTIEIELYNNSGKSYGYDLEYSAFSWWKKPGIVVYDTILSINADNQKGIPEITKKKESLANTPNPFNPETDVAYEVFESGNVVLSVLNTKGKKVIELVNGNKAAGSHSVHWNGKDSRGKDMPSGVYYAVLEVNGKRFTKKMVMLK